jgi:TolB protein
VQFTSRHDVVFASGIIWIEAERVRVADKTDIAPSNPDGTGLTRLTYNNYEERAPSWSQDGSRIVFMARVGTHPGVPGSKFEICVMNADGTNFVQLTDNAVFDGTPTFSPDGQKIVFARTPAPQQMWMMNADGTGQTQLTFPPGWNLFANWGVLRVHVH